MLFAKVNFDQKIDKVAATAEILNISKNNWFWDPYRETQMLPLMTKSGISGAVGSNSQQIEDSDFEWVAYTPTIIREWFDNTVFPWMGGRTRLMALMTNSQSKNNEHVDSDLISSKQHKFRIVLQGKTSTLYFKSMLGDVPVPDIEEPFIMNGAWPHGMHNNSKEFKLTIAAGTPWLGNDIYNNVDVMLKQSDYQMPNVQPFLNIIYNEALLYKTQSNKTSI
jgi:hypothetical protein